MSETKKPKKALDPHLEEIKSKVFVNPKRIFHASSADAHDAFPGYDNSLTLESFKENFSVTIIEATDDLVVFDMKGIDAPIANAFRRVLLSEVPTMAIDKVVMYQNTSIMPDEVLAHRLGLIPILADPRQFDYLTEKGTPSEKNTIIFTLIAKCERNKEAPNDAPNSQKFINSTVLSKHLEWIPQGKQAEKFSNIRPVHDDIVIVKLRPGQSVEAELHVTKGIGNTHAKWSPVCTASYRLLPDITFTQPIEGKLAEELVKKCPMGVFDIEDLGGKARVAYPRNCSMCRECVREEPFSEQIKLRRVRDHFIFSVESTGVYRAADVFKEAVKIFQKKVQMILNQIRKKKSKKKVITQKGKYESQLRKQAKQKAAKNKKKNQKRHEAAAK